MVQRSLATRVESDSIPTDLDQDLSAATLVDIRANIVHATPTAAQYADLAERYEADCETEIGDVMMLGGLKRLQNVTKSCVI